MNDDEERRVEEFVEQLRTDYDDISKDKLLDMILDLILDLLPDEDV
jgi:hypothetical protein